MTFQEACNFLKEIFVGKKTTKPRRLNRRIRQRTAVKGKRWFYNHYLVD